MLSDETFWFLIDVGARRAGEPRNPFRCPCMRDNDVSACLLRQARERAQSSARRRPRAARSRRRRARIVRGRSSEPSGDGGPAGPSSSIARNRRSAP